MSSPNSGAGNTHVSRPIGAQPAKPTNKQQKASQQQRTMGATGKPQSPKPTKKGKR